MSGEKRPARCVTCGRRIPWDEIVPHIVREHPNRRPALVELDLTYEILGVLLLLESLKPPPTATRAMLERVPSGWMWTAEDGSEGGPHPSVSAAMREAELFGYEFDS